VTVVVGVEAPGGVWLGCDSRVSTGESLDVLRAPKWFRLGAVVLGWSGDLRASQVALTLPPPALRKPREPALSYLLRAVVEPLRHHLEQRGIPWSGDWLLVSERRVYTLQVDWSLVASARGYAAVGGGAPYALGALDALAASAPATRVTAALTAASVHCPFVGPPFHVLRVR
jgi:ATP-dependent protease HslVU (ClpYQ) peptidase subunit